MVQWKGTEQCFVQCSKNYCPVIQDKKNEINTLVYMRRCKAVVRTEIEILSVATRGH